MIVKIDLIKYTFTITGLSILLLGCADIYEGNEDTGNGAESAIINNESNIEVEGGIEDLSTSIFPRDIAVYMLEDVICEMGDTISPVDFFDVERIDKEKPFDKEILDNLSFYTPITEEELYSEGEHSVSIVAGDHILTTSVIIQDTTPPTITVEGNKKYERGDTILYRQGVSVSDNSKVTPELEINVSDVETNLPGVYTIYYQATDNAGNVGYAEGLITITDTHVPTAQEVNSLADSILKSVITSDMSNFEKAHAIFDWCQENIRVTARARKDSVLVGAYDGLRFNEGDCFTSFATGKWLLERCGIATIDLSHDMGEAIHYWSLVNVGDGWYHFDCSHMRGGYRCFMQTDEQVKQFAAGSREHADEFNFDQTDIPERSNIIVYSNMDYR